MKLSLKKTGSVYAITAVLCLSFMPNNSFGQFGEPVPVKGKLRISNVYIIPGFNGELQHYGSLQDFKDLAPSSQMLQRDFSGFNTNLLHDGYVYDVQSAITINIGIHFADKKMEIYKANPELRIGFSHVRSSALSYYMSKTERTPYDTLTSSQGGPSQYIDSVHYQSYNMSLVYEQIKLDASLIYRTNPASRWGLFGGFGLSFGKAIKSKVNIDYMEAAFTAESDEEYFNNSHFHDHSYVQQESIDAKKGYSISTYVPMGLDFRMGNKKAFWQRMHLFYEARPGLNFTFIPELKTMACASLQQGLGLRVSF